jgi:transcription initiation factor IIE alpha subunit
LLIRVNSSAITFDYFTNKIEFTNSKNKIMKKIIILAVALIISAPAIFAQEKAGKKDTAQHATYYTCPMHSDVVTDKPGKCPKCGMDLNLSAKEEMKAKIARTYTCPIHVDVASNKKGLCPQCGKKLTFSKKEQMKAEVAKVYSCPMHADVTDSKDGKCPKCGMALTVKQ